ncbi:MAG: hypothetical protein AB1468_01925 [Candidatus Micrarchaeota archaeon]
MVGKKVGLPYIGKPVCFGAPKSFENKKKRIGKIIDYVEVKEEPSVMGWGRYCDTIELIRWDDDGSEQLRFGYYRKKEGEDDSKYRFAGQTTLTAEREYVIRLIKDALEKGFIKYSDLKPERD